MPLSVPSGLVVLGLGGAAITSPADTNENVLATVTVPAGALGPNGALRITSLWSFTSSANNKTPRIRLGGLSGTVYMGPTITTSVGLFQEVMIFNRGAANSQVGFAAASTSAGGWGLSSASANVTSAVDTAAGTTLVLTAQKASAGETLTLEAYLAELLPRFS